MSGWSPAVNRTSSITVVDGGVNATAGPVYKGLAIGKVGASQLSVRSRLPQRQHRRLSTPTSPRPPWPATSAIPICRPATRPFNIQAIGDRLYVAYARHAAGATDETRGAGLGVVAVFDMAGNYIRELTAGGALNAPWGLTVAQGNLGTFSNTILVGNFGDGKINAFDPASGAWVGPLSKTDGTPIVIDGLWCMAFGNGLNAQPATTLFFAAGPGGEAHGQYGRIDMQ